MKNLSYSVLYAVLLTAFLIISSSSFAQVDRSEPPAPGAAPEIKVSEPHKFELKNGLTVYVVENHKLPRVTVSLGIDRSPILEKEAAGYIEAAGTLLRSGTKTRSKEQLDSEIEKLGAQLFTFSRGAYGLTLKKHLDEFMTLMEDVVLNPTFPEKELEKQKTQSISSLRIEKNSPSALASNLGSKVVYGEEHPYGEFKTAETVAKITSEHLRNYYKTYFKPNIASLIFVGDITKEQAEEMAEKHFGAWEKGSVNEVAYKLPEAPEKTQIHLIHRPGAPQSVINIIYPVDYVYGQKDYLAAELMSTILGEGGFNSRIMQNLREDKGYTYGARSALSSDEHVGSFYAFGDFKNEKTAESVGEFLSEMRKITSEKVSEEELNLAKSYLAGNFARSVEDPNTIARFAREREKYNLPDDFYKTYLKRLQSVSIEEVNAAAKRYILPENAHIVIVGNADEFRDKLAAYGKITEYDADMNVKELKKIEGLKLTTAEEVLEANIKAVGGREKLEKVKNMKLTTNIFGPQYKIKMTAIKAVGEKLRRKDIIMMKGQEFISETKFDGTKGTSKSMMGTKPVEGAMATQIKFDALLFTELQYKNAGFKAELLEAEEVNGKPSYVVKFSAQKTKYEVKVYYDAETLLRVKKSENGGESFYSEFKEVEGILFPHSINVKSPQGKLKGTVKSIELNTEVDEKLFDSDSSND